ncbi:MAG TPA: flagellar hook protein FlgE [Mariprofundaceae bacterium]|nr:flagellar hook protein FlgE [Mariprofundaceae bacterium]
MGVFSALNVGASGLTAFGEAVRVIGDNISNVNTLGFKSQSVNFGDVLGQTVNVTRSNIANQVGNGVRIGAITRDQSQGSVEGTTSSTDMAINGSGLFMVQDPATNKTQYTRAGSFFLNKNSNLINGQGYQLQGWALDKNGNPTGNVTGITVANIAASASATTQVTAGVNLNSSASTINPAQTPFDPANAASYTYKSDATAYDALGNTHTVSLYFSHVGTNGSGNAVWDWHAVVDGGAVKGGTAGTPIEVGPNVYNVANSTLPASVPVGSVINANTKLGSTVTIPASALNDETGTANTAGTITWNTGQTLSSAIAAYNTTNGTTMSTTGPYTVATALGAGAGGGATVSAGSVNAVPSSVSGGVATAGAQALTFDPSTGALVKEVSPTISFPWSTAASGSISFDFGNATNIDAQGVKGKGLNGSVQLAGASSTRSMNSNGYAAGFLDHLETDSAGKINGVFTNGQRRALYQLALAKFPNPGVLNKQGNNMLTETIASGKPVLGKPNNGGLGSIQSNALEKSNVDLASEFTKLIVIQRAYEANSKTILTTDQMLSSLMSVKR